MQNSSSGSFIMLAMNHQNTTDYPWNPYNSSKRIDFKEVGNSKFQNLGFQLSNFDKSWIAGLTQREEEVDLQTIYETIQKRIFPEGTGLRHNPNLLRFSFPEIPSWFL